MLETTTIPVDLVASFPQLALTISFLVFFMLIITICVVLLGFLLLNFLKWRDREKKSLDYVLLQVDVPRENEVKIDAMEQLFSALSSMYKGKSHFWLPNYLHVQEHVSFEIVAVGEEIRFYVSVSKKTKNFLEKQIHGTYPGCSIVESEDYNMFHEEGHVAYASLKLKNMTYYPIKTYRDLAVDPLSVITSSMANLNKNESVAIQFVIAPAGGEWKSVGKKFISKTKKDEADPEKAKFNVDAKSLDGIDNKITKPGFSVSIRIVASASTQDDAKLIIDNIKGAFAQFSSDQNSFTSDKIRIHANFMIDFIYRYQPLFSKPSILTTEELATLFHFPNKSIETPRIHWLTSKRAPASVNVPDQGELYLGNSIYQGQVRPVCLLAPDRLRHVYIIGSTGVGKSVLLSDMALQDIRAGRGICFIDPHDTYEDILQLMPPERAEDVIYFDPSNTSRPLGLNLMEARTEQERHMVVTGFIGLLYKLFDPHQTGIVGPRLEHSVRNAMLTVMEADPNGTLIEVMRVLQDPGGQYLQGLLPRVTDQIVKRFWTEQIAATSEFHKSETLDYIVSKFGRFVTNKVIRNIIGQSKSAFDFRKAMDEQKIVIINLAKGLIGEENSSFLGSLLVPKILSAAMSRQDIPKPDRKPFYFYVDEFQNFATPDFAVILSEARKYGLALTVANQFMSQIEEDIKNAIIGNVGTKIVFRIGIADAQFLSGQFKPVFDEHDLLKVEAQNAYVSMLVRNEPVPPFSLNTQTDMAKRNAAMNPKLSELVKQLSALKYGRDVRDVEADIGERSGLT